jgi:hypothetical protein
MEYCLDSSVFIQAHRTYYAFDLLPSFWTVLEELASSGIIVSPVAVFSEIIRGQDELAEWAKSQKKILFTEPDNDVNEALGQIADFANDRYYDGHWIREFLNGADPWVIAQAKAHNLVVVSMEGKKITEEEDRVTKKFRGEIKIPNMCGHFGVTCMTTYDLLRKLGISL